MIWPKIAPSINAGNHSLTKPDHTLHVVLRIGGKHVQPALVKATSSAQTGAAQSRDFPRNAKKISSARPTIMPTKLNIKAFFSRYQNVDLVQATTLDGSGVHTEKPPAGSASNVYQ